mmetsp:Transcript_81825/g.226719  ORF Transcript_81825/g.226719 Transcript_81825/m.226719 type:complete len:340 (+) Transcript_81825:417-1436(+)
MPLPPPQAGQQLGAYDVTVDAVCVHLEEVHGRRVVGGHQLIQRHEGQASPQPVELRVEGTLHHPVIAVHVGNVVEERSGRLLPAAQVPRACDAATPDFRAAREAVAQHRLHQRRAEVELRLDGGDVRVEVQHGERQVAEVGPDVDRDARGRLEQAGREHGRHDVPDVWVVLPSARRGRVELAAGRGADEAPALGVGIHRDGRKREARREVAWQSFDLDLGPDVGLVGALAWPLGAPTSSCPLRLEAVAQRLQHLRLPCLRLGQLLLGAPQLVPQHQHLHGRLLAVLLPADDRRAVPHPLHVWRRIWLHLVAQVTPGWPAFLRVLRAAIGAAVPVEDGKG